MSATNRGCERKAYDFYTTPPETIRAFLANFDGISYSWFVWERGGTGCIGHQTIKTI